MTTAHKLRQLPLRLRELRVWADAAFHPSGKSMLRQLSEIKALRRLGGQCGVSDYYWYRLYDPQYQRGRGAADYLGWRLQAQLCAVLNPRHAVLPAWDKITFMTLAHAAGLPVAPVAATYSRAPALAGVLGVHLRTADDVARYLRSEAEYPLFSEPSYSQQGLGATSIDGYHSASDSLCLADGSRLTTAAFLTRLTTTLDRRYHKPECGQLFQPRLSSAREIVDLTGWPAISGVRVTCLNGPDGALPLRAFWKVCLPPNQVDNFSKGKYGNLLADVDLETGTVSRLLAGIGPQHMPMTQLPHNQRDITGFRLPGWTHVLDACRRAGPVFPLLGLHGWDFALTDQGPLMLELNDTVSTEALQLYGRGLLTSDVRAFLKQHCDTRQHDWIARL